MSNFGKLLNWEIARFSKFYGALFVITLLLQLLDVWLYTHDYMNNAERAMESQSMTAVQYVQNYSKASLNGYDNILFDWSISLCGVTLLLYIFLIWYKEWVGRSTFAYRLLMLPTSRMNVYLAKLSSIVLFVWGLVAYQFLLLYVRITAFEAFLPSEFRLDVTVSEIIRHHPILKILLPSYFTEFALYYGAGVVSVIILFTAVLLERSFRFKGIAAGILYIGAAVFLIILPGMISEIWVPDFFFPSELVQLELVMGILVTALSLWFSSYLLHKKVTV
ncbi:hypothetical protein HZF08_19695 [Paenibacillus sp. CGMCC 1.16610]|uniref:ABC transporter permease n=1 Tax=Paenibacillus anseongense TaxID=2682845 RepID=A0ABW9U6I8_9BACL|nr:MULTISPECIES: hypothetical protein [Paenibacillus]MBA2940525.1 hypothetical protein [Paenibacillus sp. CGMCC 1.16610]MVQ35702.1 hypothetical protein [Paenibacillus anseongense]